MADLAELLCARLCHDLAGPLGTLAGALEMAAEGEPEALAIAGQEAARAASRLRFLRAAWAGGAGALDGPGLARLAAGVPGGERMAVDFSGLGELPEGLARLVLCVLSVAVLGAPRGRLLLTGDAAGVTAVLEGGAWPDGAASPADARTLPVLLLNRVAQALGHEIDTARRGEGVWRMAPRAGG